MRFAFPVALWLLPLAIVPLLARRTRPVRRLPVATMHFWATGAASSAAPLPRRLRRHAHALVQAAVIAAVVLAIARPSWTWSGGVAAIVVDTSLSMGAVAGGPSRLSLAVQRAAAWAERLPAGTRVRLITTSPVPRLAGDHARGDDIERALAALRPTAAGARLDAAVAFARAGAPSPGAVLVVTDRQAPTARGGTDWETVGAPAGNAAVVTLGTRRAHATSPDADAVAQVWNYGAETLTTTVTFTYEGRVVTRDALTLAPRAGATAATVIRGASGLVTATIDAADAIAADNTRSAMLPRPLAVRVALTGPGRVDAFLERALRSRQGIEIVERADGADVAVCTGCTSGDAAALPDGVGVLAVAPAQGTRGASVPLTGTAAGSGFRAPQGLDGIEAVVVDGPRAEAGTIVATAGSSPAILATEEDGRRVVELRLDLQRSPLALTPALPILIADSVDWLAGRAFDAATVDAGATIVRRIPRNGSGPVTVTGPGGEPVQADSSAALLTIATAAPGVYDVRRGAVSERFVVNPVVAGESDLSAPASVVDALDAPPTANATAQRDLTMLLLAGALLLIAVEWRMRPGPWRSWRAATVGLLAIATVAPSVPWGDAPRTVVFALDVSDSMAPRRGDALTQLRTATERMRPGDEAGLVVFGAEASVERPLDGTPLAGAAPTSRVPGGATSLEQGLRAARAALPGDGSGRVVLVSDGRQTAGRVRDDALAARDAGIPIDVLVPRAGRAATARPVVTRVAAPPTVRQGEGFEVRATVEGAPGARATVVFDGREPVRRAITLPASGIATVAIDARATQPGVAIQRASIEAGETLADFGGDPAGAVVAVSGDAQMLYVSNAAPVVTPAGYRIAHVPPAAAARTSSALAPFDAVVLDDVEPEQLDEAQRRALAQHVEQGGGLFVLGGPRSLEPGGARDPLDAVLPLDFRPRQGQRAPGLALVVVFDKSGSMDDRIDGAPKIEFARQAVERVLASLPPTDAVGVIAFDAEAMDVAPLQPGHEGPALAERLARVRPSGATAIAPAVERAVSWLRDPAASAYARRLVLLVSDGRTTPADHERARAALRTPGIDVSTVALGDEADRGFLGELARAGNGRAFYPRRLGELPALAAREAVRVSGGHVVDERFTVQAVRHPILAGLDTTTMPALGGYVVGTARPGAEIALRSPLGDPVLALWRHGLGRVAVYTAGLHSPWSAGLRGWNGGPALLAQTTRWVSRRLDHPFLHTTFAERDGQLELVVDARRDDGAFLNGLDVRAQARTPAGATHDVVLTASGPGSYRTTVPLADPGPYLFSIAATAADGSLDARTQRGFFWTAAQERPGAADAALLSDIARVTGGRVLTPGSDPFDGPRPRDRRDIGAWLVGAALVLFLGHVFAPFGRRPPAFHATAPSRREAA